MSAHDRVRKLILGELKNLSDQGEKFNSRTIAKWLIVNHPEEVQFLLDEALESVITDQVRHVVIEYRNSQRSSLNYFGEVSQILPSESSARLLYAVDHSGNRKEVAKMTKQDAMYVITLMKSRASDQIAIAAWLERLTASLKPGQVVADVYSDQEIDTAYRQLVRRK